MKLEWTKRFPLTEVGISRINAVPGVYRLMYFNQTKNNYCIYYVGQAQNLNERLSQHLSGNEENKCCQRRLDDYDCYFRVAGVARQADRDGIEVALYNKYKPSCVERIPDVDQIDINFE